MTKTEIDGGVLISTGDTLTIETAAELTGLIKAALAEADRVILEFSENPSTDATALQILCSACKSAAQSGKEFTFRGDLPSSLSEMVAVAGGERNAICKQNNDTPCIWFGGKS